MEVGIKSQEVVFKNRKLLIALQILLSFKNQSF